MRLRCRLLALLLLAAATLVRADMLYVQLGDGRIVSVDPASGALLGEVEVTVPGGVVTRGVGLALRPGGGGALGLLGVVDACSLDPTRTIYAGGNGTQACRSFATREQCEAAFHAVGGRAMSCYWDEAQGCLGCGPNNAAAGRCINTCAPPPICDGAPSRTLLAGAEPSSCARFDGDPASCAAAYFRGEAGTAACFEQDGACLGCDPARELAGECSRVCVPPGSCDDPARAIYLGEHLGCALAPDENACDRAYDSVVGLPASCYWGGGSCLSCHVFAAANGACINTCAPPQQCAEPSQVHVGGCFLHAGDQATCEQSFEAGIPDPLHCYYRDGQCLVCDPVRQETGECVNRCAPPACDGDPSRTTLLSNGGQGCRAFDGDPAACAAAYFPGACGVSSCTYDGGANTCVPCEPGDPGGCANACGAFDTLTPEEQATTLVALDVASGAGTIVGSTGDTFDDLAVDAAGTPYTGTSGASMCFAVDALYRLDDATAAPTRLVAVPEGTADALAFHATDGLLYRLRRLDPGFELQAIDPVGGSVSALPVNAPNHLFPVAMTHVPACDGFLVANACENLFIVSPLGEVHEVAYYLPGADCGEPYSQVAGIAFEGAAVCPPVLVTTTTTTTSTTTTSSTTTSTIPTELLTGRTMLLADKPGAPRKRRLRLVSKDPALTLGGGNGSADDPVLHGGSLRIVATAPGAFDTTYPLTGWRYLGAAGAGKGYVTTDDAPFGKLLVRPGRVLRVVGRGAGLGHSLFVDPGAVRIELRLGARRYCLEFGGTVKERTTRRYRAVEAPAPPGCGAG